MTKLKFAIEAKLKKLKNVEIHQNHDHSHFFRVHH